MATPEIQAVIDAAAQYANYEAMLANLRSQKTSHQNSIADLNTQIAEMVTVVANSKTALKTAANNI